MAGLGDLVSGFQSGKKFAGDARRNYLLDRAIEGQIQGDQFDMLTRRKAWKEYGIDPSEFGGVSDVLDDPYWKKLGDEGFSIKDFFGNIFGRRKKKQKAVDPDIMTGSSDVPAPNATNAYLKDGGAVRKYADGTPSGGAKKKSAWEHVAPNLALLDDQIKRDLETEWGDVVAPGKPLKERALELYDVGEVGARGALATFGGLIQGARDADAVVQRGVEGLVTRDPYTTRPTSSVAAQPASPSTSASPQSPEQMGPPSEDQMGPPSEAAPSQALPVASRRRRTATSAPPEESRINPDNVRHIDPNSVPGFTATEWDKFKTAHVRQALRQGKSIEEAEMGVLRMQAAQGTRLLQTAAMLIDAGRLEEAGMTARMAFQYLPNGVDVQFGIAETAKGPVLVGMGVDEETGKPTANTVPMAINSERLYTMAENFSNPAAVRTWTKDMREFEQLMREYYELKRPEAESLINYRADMGDAALTNADASVARAIGAGSKALTPTQRTTVKDSLNKSLRELASYDVNLDNGQLLQEMMGVIEQVIINTNGQISGETLVSELTKAYARGPEEYEMFLRRLGMTRQVVPTE